MFSYVWEELMLRRHPSFVVAFGVVVVVHKNLFSPATHQNFCQGGGVCLASSVNSRGLTQVYRKALHATRPNFTYPLDL